jgi:hypothetical protein
MNRSVVCLLFTAWILYICKAEGFELEDPQAETQYFKASSDPFGEIDIYKLLSKADLSGKWAKDDGRNLTEKLGDIQNFMSILHIDVKLVGFDGDGNFGIRVSDTELLRYFETVLEEHEKDAMVVNVRPGQTHQVPISRKFFFRVMKARKGLSEDISDRVRSWVLTKVGHDASSAVFEDAVQNGVAVPVTLVDELVRR